MNKRRPLPNHLRVQVLARDNYRCLMCGRSKDVIPLQVDHVIPVAEGGTDELSNLATLCQPCNNGKSAFRFSDYRNMNLIPDGLSSRFAFFEDGKTGDFSRYHLYLYYKSKSDNAVTEEKFHHTWTITGTQFAQSSNRDALILRRRGEQSDAFLEEIRQSLAAGRFRLILNEEGLLKIGV
jgi:5-methylcytosine-specific restriction enzyme A